MYVCNYVCIQYIPPVCIVYDRICVSSKKVLLKIKIIHVVSALRSDGPTDAKVKRSVIEMLQHYSLTIFKGTD